MPKTMPLPGAIFRHGAACAVLVLAGCVPAKVPPQLIATPGVAVVVQGGRYETAVFSAAYPAGWRVITSPANEPPFVILASPDQCTIILLSTDPRPAPDAGLCARAETRTVSAETGNFPKVYAAMRAAADDWASAEATFTAIVESIVSETNRDS